MLIGLNGKKRAGKDTAYERIRHLLIASAPVERASFADPLYDSAAATLGVTPGQLRVFKNDPDVTVEVWDNVNPVSRVSVREYLQRYGTEAHRQVFGDNFWVDNVDLSHERKIVVVTDVRFANEAQAVVDAGGTVVRVVGPPDVEEAGDGHASEAPLPTHLIDATLDNSTRDDGFRALDSQVMELVLRLLREERS